MKNRAILVPVIISLLSTTCVYAQTNNLGNNVRSGPGAGANIQNSGAGNVMLGQDAGGSTTLGEVNVMIGNHAGFNNTTGRWNTFIGNGAGQANVTGENNTYIGDGAGYEANGSKNMMLGLWSGFHTTSGEQNVMIGAAAGINNTTGSRNVYIGYEAGAPLSSGYITNAVAIGANTLATQSNTVILGNNANVGIGTSAPQYRLSVNGTIGAKEVKVTASGWADFVFEKSYKLKSLALVERYIKVHKHLPDVPAAAQVQASGIDLGTTQTLLLQKIEELTLYAIQQQGQIGRLERQLRNVRRR